MEYIEPGQKIFRVTFDMPDGSETVYDFREYSYYVNFVYDKYTEANNKHIRGSNRVLKINSEYIALTKTVPKDEAEAKEIVKKLKRLEEESERYQDEISELSESYELLLDGLKALLEQNGYKYERDFWYKCVSPSKIIGIFAGVLTKDLAQEVKKKM